MIKKVTEKKRPSVPMDDELFNAVDKLADKNRHTWAATARDLIIDALRAKGLLK